jgi:MFS family permease
VSRLRGLPREAWVVLAGDALSSVGTGLTLPFLVVYLHRVRGVALEPAALAASMLALAGLIANPAAGSLSDRVGARSTLVLGLVVSAAGAGVMTLVRDAWQGLAAAGLVGFGAALVWPAQETLLASVVSPERRSSVFAVRYATMNAGLGLGALGAAAIVDLRSPGSFVAIYLVDGLSFLLFIPILLLGVPASAGRSSDVERAARPSGGGYRAILRDSMFVRVWLLTALLVTVGYAQVNASFPAFATRMGGVAASGVALANAANMITVVVAQLFVLRLMEGRRRTTALLGVCGFFATTWSLMLIAGGLGGGAAAVVAFSGALIAFAFGEVLLSPTLPSMVNDLASDELRGRYNGVYVLAWTSGFALGPAIGGLALAGGDSTALFLGLIASCGVGAVLVMRLARRLPPELNVVGVRELAEPGAPPAVAVEVGGPR